MKSTSEFVSALFEIEVMGHIAHLQTTSFAQHAALDELYKGMPELRDAFCEAYQGQYDIIKGYKSIPIQEGIDMVGYLRKQCIAIKEYRSTQTEGYIQQLIDNILEFIYGVEYKLRFLK